MCFSFWRFGLAQKRTPQKATSRCLVAVVVVVLVAFASQQGEEEEEEGEEGEEVSRRKRVWETREKGGSCLSRTFCIIFFVWQLTL